MLPRGANRGWTAATDIGDLPGPGPGDPLGYRPRLRYLLIEMLLRRACTGKLVAGYVGPSITNASAEGAAGLRAVAVVWLAAGFRQEYRAALDRLPLKVR